MGKPDLMTPPAALTALPATLAAVLTAVPATLAVVLIREPATLAVVPIREQPWSSIRVRMALAPNSLESRILSFPVMQKLNKGCIYSKCKSLPFFSSLLHKKRLYSIGMDQLFQSARNVVHVYALGAAVN